MTSVFAAQDLLALSFHGPRRSSKRAPFYGALMLFGALMACWLAASVHITWLSVAIYILAVIVAAVGFLLTFRDYSF